MGSAVKAVTNVGSNLISGLTGTGSNAGLLGTGQFKGSQYEVNRGLITDADVIKNAQQAEAREAQMRLARALEAQASGQAPSIAENQLKAATDRAIAQQAGMAASGRGNAALLQRQAMTNQATLGQEAARDASITRMNEQNQARQLLAQNLSGTRSQDISAAESDRNARIMAEQIQAGQSLGVQGINAGAFEVASRRRGDLIGNIGGTLASAFSDENKKEVIKETVNDELKKFVDSIKAYKYEYKDEDKDSPLAGDGEYISPMAQDLEETELGADMVIDTPEGKVVDYGKGFGTILASQAMLNDRLTDIEKALMMKNKGK